MEEQVVTHTCQVCGAPLTIGESAKLVCERCSAVPWYGPRTATEGSVGEAEPERIDPDRPRWGSPAAIAVWFFSVLSTVLVPVAGVFAWYAIEMSKGAQLPAWTDAEALKDWLLSPAVVLVQVVATLPAHFLTLLVCWAVVARSKRRPFLESLGWNWAGKTAAYWSAVSVLVVIGIFFGGVLAKRLIPDRETSFDELLKTGPYVRLAMAILATATAPLVEEIVYRGVLFGAFRKRLGAAVSVVFVTLLFAGVHLPQYWGAWATMSMLLLLSLILTVIRARTSSLLPCYVIHLLNNGVASLFILLGKF